MDYSPTWRKRCILDKVALRGTVLLIASSKKKKRKEEEIKKKKKSFPALC
jgi:hypothetical protein